MMCKSLKYFFSLLALFMVFNVGYSQELDSLKVNDERYREDQFYIGFTYNLLLNKPQGVSQRGFSNGIHLGVIRDMPINSNRTVAVGIGLGYSGNFYNDNLVITEDQSGVLQYQVLEGGFSQNKLAIHMIELPLQFRWRNSTMESHKFWRVYSGLKLGYVFANRAKFKGDIGEFKITNLDHLNRLQYGLELNFGYNTWNFHATYVLNNLFNNDAQINGVPIEVSPLKVGLMFYIL